MGLKIQNSKEIRKFMADQCKLNSLLTFSTCYSLFLLGREFYRRDTQRYEEALLAIVAYLCFSAVKKINQSIKSQNP